MLKKIAGYSRPCFSSQHNPPSHAVLSLGLWEHTCPDCAKQTVFWVNRPQWHTCYATPWWERDGVIRRVM